MKGAAVAFLVAGLLFCPRQAEAYVDPGIMGSLFQVIYIFLFGVLAAWFLRPFRFLSGMFRKIRDFFSRKR